MHRHRRPVGVSIDEQGARPGQRQFCGEVDRQCGASRRACGTPDDCDSGQLCRWGGQLICRRRVRGCAVILSRGQTGGLHQLGELICVRIRCPRLPARFGGRRCSRSQRFGELLGVDVVVEGHRPQAGEAAALSCGVRDRHHDESMLGQPGQHRRGQLLCVTDDQRGISSGGVGRGDELS